MPTETRFQEIKRYVRLNERDAELLRAFGVLASAPAIHADAVERLAERARDLVAGKDG